MTILREGSLMYASIFSVVLFMILFESRYPKKKTILLTVGVMGTVLLINFALLMIVGPVSMNTLLLLTCSVPSVIFFWFLAKYRDGRFIFTFCFADSMMLELIDLTSILDFYFGNTYIFMAVSRLLLCPILVLVFWKWVRPVYLNLQNKVSNGWYRLAVIALLFYVLLTMAMSVPSHIVERPEQLPAFIMLMILLPVIYGHSFLTLHNQQKNYEAAEKEKIQSVQVASLLSRVEEFSAANELLREERHNFRHTMRTVAILAENGEYEKLKDMASEYAQSEPEKTLESYCKHTLLDAVFSSYLQEAKRKNIRVSVKASFPERLPVNESELAMVFANALENAINACEKIEKEKRYIEVKVITVPCFMLQIRNSFDGIIAFDKSDIPISPKKEHGFGTRSIVSFCEKNNAFHEFKAENQEFALKIIFQ